MARMGVRAMMVAMYVGPAYAEEFLGMKAKQEISSTEVQQALQALLTSRHSHPLSSIEDELREMFVALPKNSHGLLDHDTVRYGLHRYFVQKHGWYMNGLDPHSEAYHGATPTLMKERAPSYIQTLLEERLHGEGLGLNDMAVFAAAMASLVHEEAAAALRTIFDDLNLPSENLTAEQVDTAEKNFVAREIIGEPLMDNMSEVYLGWEDLRAWLEDLRQSQGQTVRSFESSVSLVQDVSHHFGTHQKPECMSLKRRLSDMDKQRTGRVLLRDFYSGLQNDPNHHFAESVDYLRNLGALDERDSQRMSVVIPNYIISKTNCLAASGFYAICCSNECEDLMRHVEHEIAAPSGSPARLVEVISSLPSDTVDAPRNLSASLYSRMDEIAKQHGGMVPLYGRLFSQFMHHAYPRECPFPHVSGTTSPMSPEEWLSQGLSDVATLEEVERYFAADHELQHFEQELPWLEFEELMVDYMLPAEVKANPALRKGMFLLAVMSVAFTMVKALKVADQPSEKPVNKFSI